MKTRTVRLGTVETLGATRITRRDFLKIGGTGLVGATLLGTAGCGSIFGGEQGGTGGGGGGSNAIGVPPRTTSTPGLGRCTPTRRGSMLTSSAPSSRVRTSSTRARAAPKTSPSRRRTRRR
jgi:hypothetical protein